MSLSDVIELLRCPHCHLPLSITDRVAHCPDRHSFDIARQGYLNLITGRQPANADTAPMIAARDRFLSAGHYRPLVDLLAEYADRGERDRPRRIAEVGAGTGYYLAGVLDRLDSAVGLASDISVAACRRAARTHDRIGAVVADTWTGLPVADGVIDLLLVIFAPRNPVDFARLLAPGGRAIIATPGPQHLHQLRRTLGLLGIEPAKQDRLRETMIAAGLIPGDRHRWQQRVQLDSDAVTALVEMGPNAHHTDSERLSRQIADLESPYAVDLDVWITEFTAQN